MITNEVAGHTRQRTRIEGVGFLPGIGIAMDVTGGHPHAVVGAASVDNN